MQEYMHRTIPAPPAQPNTACTHTLRYVTISWKPCLRHRDSTNCIIICEGNLPSACYWSFSSISLPDYLTQPPRGMICVSDTQPSLLLSPCTPTLLGSSKTQYMLVLFKATKKSWLPETRGETFTSPPRCNQLFKKSIQNLRPTQVLLVKESCSKQAKKRFACTHAYM